MDCFVACARRNYGHDFRSPGHRPYGFKFQTAAVYRHGFAISPRLFARGLPEFRVPLISEGAGNAGRPMRPQPRVPKRKRHTSVVTTVTPEITRHSPRNGFTAYFVLSS